MKLSRKQAQAMGIHVPHKRKRTRKKATDRDPDGNQGRNKLFDAMCAANGCPIPVSEYKFDAYRKWKFDYLFDGWLALEVQGGNWIHGHHTRASALDDEYEKVNAAAAAGYTVIFCTPEDIQTGKAFEYIRNALQSNH